MSFVDIFFRCITKDLLFTNDGNPDFLSRNINVTKITKMSEIIFSFMEHVPYIGIEEDSDASKWLLSDSVPYSEKELDVWSRLAEPIDEEEKIIELFEANTSLRSDVTKLQSELENTKRLLQEVQYMPHIFTHTQKNPQFHTHSHRRTHLFSAGHGSDRTI
jgi:hypothetical protein